MSRVLFVQHGEYDGAGLFGQALADRGVELVTVHPWRGEPVPVTPAAFDGIALGGGGMSAYETAEFPFLASEMALVRATRDAGKPLLGMCLGAQLMAAALGGNVFASPDKEIGFYEVEFTAAAARDSLWQGHTGTFSPVHWHGDTFSLPPQATLLASSALTANQLFRIGDTMYGFQFHLEIDLPVLTAMVTTDDGELPSNGVDPDTFLRDAAKHLPAVEPTARAVFTRWAGLLN